MSGVQSPYSSSHLRTINQATLKSLEKKSVQTNLFGGFTEDGNRAWFVRGPVLEVVSAADGDGVSCHHFDVATEDPTIHITSLKEFVFRGVEAFLLGLRSDGGKGLVCVYEIDTGKVAMAVRVPHGVTSVEVVTEHGGVDAPNFCLSHQMQKFFGIAAIGTDKGHFYLLDMRVDECDISSEGFPRESKVVNLETQYIENLRLIASNKGQHLCLEMNSAAYSYFSFRYQRPDNESLRDYSPDDIFVSNITYLPHTGTLAVGFNFGCFQLWQLAEPALEYSSPVSPQVTPVTHFASQEPTDDPQFFCYLWIGRGPLPWESSQDVPTDVHLFQLSYEEKTYHGSYGHLFRELNNCIPRFQHNFTHDPHLSEEEPSVGSRLIGCWTLEKVLSQEEEKEPMEDGEDEDYTPTDRTLTAFVWEGGSETANGQFESNYFLAIFDLNQWYYAQMPAKLRHSQSDKSLCKYFAFYSLDSIQAMCTPDFLLNLHINSAGISRYQSTTPATLELHQQPTALSFDATCLMETALVGTTILGLQKKVLAEMSAQGPMILREPAAIYARCCEAQLLIRSSLLGDAGGRLTLERQRDAILSVALENDQLSFILQCIYNWSQGDFSSGISLRALMEWAWKQVTERKQMIDNMCEPLFDGGGTFVDFQTIRRLSRCSQHHNHLVVIFKALLKQSETTTEQGAQDLTTKLVVLSLLTEHLKALLWFVRCGLLPECSDQHGPVQVGQFSYPVTLLRNAYHQRRAQLQKLSSLDTSVLLIDGIIEEAGQDLTALWQRGDETSDGLYPPPSLHALLDIHLMESMPLFTKQCIVGYMMLDIESTLTNNRNQRLSEHIRKFDSVMSMPVGLTKLVHAFWLLDHRDFAEALNMLLDPMTDTSLSSWQHGSIVRAFLYHGEGQKALQYVRAVRPALTTPGDIKLHLTVLLANGLTSEAFYFQRNYHDESTSEELLYHLFLGSQQTKTMNQLLKLPYNEREELTLRKYLQETTEPNSQEILVMHLLQRAQFVESTRLNNKLNQQMMMMETDTASREGALSRNVILEKCRDVMPAVQRKLAFNPEVKRSRIQGTRREVPRPKPLSTKINPAKTQRVVSHALLMSEVLDKIAEARECLKEDEMTPGNSPPGPLSAVEPFVGTPITPSSKSRRRYSTVFVYPDPSEANANTWQPSTAPSHLLNHASRLLSQWETPSTPQARKRPSSNYSAADAMSLLQTPLVQKKTPKRSQAEQPPANTPQSILRVRQVVRRSPSPALQVEPPLPPVILEMKTSDIRLPTPPPIRRHLSSAGDSEERKERREVAPPTPQKHLRFTEDTKGATPSPIVPMESSSSEPSPEEVPSTARGPSPGFSTPPSGSPRHETETGDEQQTMTTFGARLAESQQEYRAPPVAETEMAYDITQDDAEPEDEESDISITLPDPPMLASSGWGSPPAQSESEEEVPELGETQMEEEEFYDVENTEDLAVRPAPVEDRPDGEDTNLDVENDQFQDVPGVPVDVTEERGRLYPELPVQVQKEQYEEFTESPPVVTERGESLYPRLSVAAVPVDVAEEWGSLYPELPVQVQKEQCEGVTGSPPVVTERGESLYPKLPVGEEATEKIPTTSHGIPDFEEASVAPPVAGSGDMSHFSFSATGRYAGIEPQAAAGSYPAIEKDAEMESDVAMETDVAMEIREGDEEDVAMEIKEADQGYVFEEQEVLDDDVEEASVKEDSDVVFNFDARQSENTAVGNTGLGHQSAQQEEELTGIPFTPPPPVRRLAVRLEHLSAQRDRLDPAPPSEPPIEDSNRSYGSDDLPRPPIHPLPEHIEDKYGSPPSRISPAKVSPQRSFIMEETHPFPTPPQRTDTEDEGMDTELASLPLNPLQGIHGGNAEIQTSPFVEEGDPPAGAMAASPQMTSGLELAPRTPGTAQRRAPFNMSLRSHSKQGVQPSPDIKPTEGTEERAVTPVPARMDQEPIPGPLTPVVPHTRVIPLTPVVAEEPAREREGLVALREPAESGGKPEKIGDDWREADEAQDTTATAALPFIFSPPSTRSKSRRQTISFFRRETRDSSMGMSLLQHDPLSGEMSLLPAAASPSLADPSPRTTTRRGRLSMTPTSSPALLDASLTRSTRKGRRSMTPNPSPAMVLDTSLTRSTRRGRRSMTPTTSPAVEEPGQISTRKLTKPEGVGPKRVTRSRKVSITQEPSDSPLNLISPIKEEEDEGANPSKPQSQRVVRVPNHSMSLRTTRSRTVKLF